MKLEKNGDSNELSNPRTASDEEEHSTNNVDLDTRIEMMFKGKTFGKFLQLGSDSDEENKDDENSVPEIAESKLDYEMMQNMKKKLSVCEENSRSSSKSVVENKNGTETERMDTEEISKDSVKSSLSSANPSTSTPPSAYESKKTYKQNRKLQKLKQSKEARRNRVKVDSDASDISSSEDDLLAKGSYSPATKPNVIVKDEDQMSLSSLSSTEPPKMEEEEKKDEKLVSAADPLASFIYPPGTQGAFFPTAAGIQQSQTFPYNYQQMMTYQQNNNPYYYYPYVSMQNYAYDPYRRQSSAASFQNQHNPYEGVVKKVVDQLVSELKVILKKDFNKKMVENTAFKKLEAWYAEKEAKQNSKTKDTNTTESNDIKTAVPDINRILAQASEKFESSTSFGLGLRGTIPKLPSFRRVRRKPSPIQQDEDSRKSDQDDDDMVHRSDSEKEEIPNTSKTAYSRPSVREMPQSHKRKNSVSSFSSSSDEESSESEEESDVDSSSAATDSETDYKKPIISGRKDRENNRIYSDTDSDENQESDAANVKSIATPTPSAKVDTSKPKIYSDSESDVEFRKRLLHRNRSPSKTPEGGNTPIPDHEIDFISDSDFGQISKPPTPGRDSSPIPSITSMQQQPMEVDEKPPVAKTSSVSLNLDRVYSDSEEEREYLEKKRIRNEYLLKLEREVEEEWRTRRERETQMGEQQKESIKSEPTVPLSTPSSPKHEEPIKIEDESMAASIDDSTTPPTPGTSIVLDEPILSAVVEKKKPGRKPGRPKGRPRKQSSEQTVEKTQQQIPLVQREPDHIKNNEFPVPAAIEPPPAVKNEEEILKEDLKLSSSSSSDDSTSQASHVALDHCYSMSVSPISTPDPSGHDDRPYFDAFVHDHYYGRMEPSEDDMPKEGRPKTPQVQQEIPQLQQEIAPTTSQQGPRPVGRPRKDPNAPKASYTKRDKNILQQQVQPVSHESYLKPKKKPVQPPPVAAIASSSSAATSMLPWEIRKENSEPFVPTTKYPKREFKEEVDILFKFLTSGVDAEDIEYLRMSYQMLLMQNDTNSFYWLNSTHWVDHCVTDRSFIAPPPAKKRRKELSMPEPRIHDSGCARTEGYYKIDSQEKARYKYHHLKGTAAGNALDKTKEQDSIHKNVSKMQSASREARSNQRRLLTAFGASTESDLLKFNQLKFRKKQLKFAKSAIHDWGLFAMEPIAADEMVIEYVGQMVRPSVADLRETKYEAIGIGSSYLFRIDMETIIDATKCGNLARFINHSCNVSISVRKNDFLIIFFQIFSQIAMQK